MTSSGYASYMYVKATVEHSEKKNWNYSLSRWIQFPFNFTAFWLHYWITVVLQKKKKSAGLVLVAINDLIFYVIKCNKNWSQKSYFKLIVEQWRVIQ